MAYLVKNNLEETEYRKVINFLNSLNFYCIEQHPAWNDKIDKYPQKYFIGMDENGLVNCFGNIIISKGPFKYATINFGPAFKDFTILTNAIQFLYSYFTSEKYIYFSIQLGNYLSNETELLEYKVNKNLKPKYYFANGHTWTSTSVDLNRTENEILKSFSKGHKSSIKSVYSKNSLKVRFENNLSHLQEFIELYKKMMASRKLFVDENLFDLFNNINQFIYESNNGFIGYIFDESILVGGVIIIYQGKTARYYKGASDPDRRDLPILHFGLFEAMKKCREAGILSIDLWGYNHFATESDQIFYINKFKKGFGGEFTFFPKRMNFILKSNYFKIYQFLKYVKNKLYFFKKS